MKKRMLCSAIVRYTTTIMGYLFPLLCPFGTTEGWERTSGAGLAFSPARTTARLFLILILLAVGRVQSGGQNISTVVGYGPGGIAEGTNINGGLATASELNLPSAVSTHTDGSIYILDAGNRRIRKINTSGNLFTVAGLSGLEGFTGDGGPASDAQIDPLGSNRAVSIGMDAAGNFYIPDTDNHRVRKVTVSTGNITTAAGSTSGFAGDGGQATAAAVRFMDPTSVILDAAGNIYIADRNNHRIRKVTVATGILTTVAGNGTGAFGGDGGQATAANLFRPTGVAVDASGNIFIADFSNNRIRKVNTSGVISTVAGYTTTVGFSGDGGQATAANLNLNGGSTTACIAVAVDAAGNFYIADASNHCIRKVTVSTGIITTVAGVGTVSGFSGDGGQATAANLFAPRGVWLDASGNIYIADGGNYRVRKVEASTGIISTIAGTGVVGDFSNHGIATSTQLYYPKDVALDPGGNMYVVMDAGHGVVWKINAAGVIAAVAGTGVQGNTGDGGPATLAQVDISGVAVDANCNLYLTQDNYCIRKVDAATGIISRIVGTGAQGFSGDGGQATAAQINNHGSGVHIGIEVDASGNIYFSDKANHRIRKITVSTGIISTVAGNGTEGYLGDGGQATAARINDPQGIDIDASGNIYIADMDNFRVRKVTVSTGIITTVAGNGVFDDLGDGGQATAASLKNPRDVAIDKTTGDIYIADRSANRVRKVNASTGIITTLAGNAVYGFSGDGAAATAAELRAPSGIAVSSGANCLFIADRDNSRIRFVDFGGSCASIPGSCPLILPVQLLSFIVKCDESVAHCNWSTASESNNDYFAVERSTDAKSWTEIGKVKGVGNSSTIHNYEFIDVELPLHTAAATLFYRLKQTDYNGQHEYFGPVVSNCSMDNNWKLIIQNIVGSSLNGTLIAGEDAELVLNIVDIQGRIIKQKKISASKGSNLLQLELDGMDAGMYFIMFRNVKVQLYQKFIKQNGSY